jgi:hypothetical protein
MSAGEEAFTPRTEKVALAIEHDDGMVPPAEHIQLIFFVNTHRRNLAVGPSLREPAPTFGNFI